MTPREWVGCVVGVRDGETSGATDAHADTIRRAWRGARTGRLRRVALLTFGGQTMCLEDWASQRKMRPHVLGSRIRRGWSIERALTVPVGAPETRLRPNNGGGQRCKKA